MRPRIGNLPQHLGVGQSRVGVAELLPDGVLELEVGRGGPLGRVGVLVLFLLARLCELGGGALAALDIGVVVVVLLCRCVGQE